MRSNRKDFILLLNWIELRPLSPTMTVPCTHSECSESAELVAYGQPRARLGLWLIDKLPGDREPLELVAGFDTADATDATKPDGTRHPPENRQYTLHLNFDPGARSLGGDHKHSILADVHAVPGTVVVYVVGPAEQEWQSYLEPPRIPSLD